MLKLKSFDHLVFPRCSPNLYTTFNHSSLFKPVSLCVITVANFSFRTVDSSLYPTSVSWLSLCIMCRQVSSFSVRWNRDRRSFVFLASELQRPRNMTADVVRCSTIWTLRVGHHLNCKRKKRILLKIKWQQMNNIELKIIKSLVSYKISKVDFLHLSSCSGLNTAICYRIYSE